jgi:hypothetical protein
MIRKTIYILTLFLGIILSDSAAQNSQTMYYMNIPQNHLLNPALRPSNSLYIGLPGLSGMNVNINNNFVNFSDVFMNGQSSDSVFTFLHPKYDINDFLAKIKDKNSFEPQASVQLFGIGFSVGKASYVFLDINDRVEGNIVLPGDLFELAFKGNEGFVGRTIDLSSLRGDVRYYREAGLGFSKDFTSKLRIGIKGKLLFGIAGASIDNKSLGITVNEDYSHTLNADLNLNISGPVNIRKNADHEIDSIWIDDTRFKSTSQKLDFLLNTKNIGLGIDIGAVYQFSDKLSASVAVTDIGYIKWKTDVLNLKTKNKFDFSGLNMLDVINGTKTIDEVGQEVLDSLKESFIVSDSKVPFTTYLPFGVTLGANYSVSKSFSLGILSYSRIIGQQIREALTLSANVNLGNAFSTSISYTAANHRYDNFGAGLAFRPGIFQIYLLADRIPVMRNEIKSDNNTIPLPTSWNTVHLRLGMNIVFGNKIKKKDDKPMVPVE